MNYKTSWSNEDLKSLTKVENHTFMFDGYEYTWYRKLKDGTEDDIEAIYTPSEVEDEILQLEKITNNIINSISILVDKKLDLFSSTVNNK